MKCVTPLPICPDPESLRVRNETPTGALDCVNLLYTTASAFEAGTLEVYLDGRRLDWGLDFIENPDLMSFTITLDPLDGNRLKIPFRHSESLRVDYNMLTVDSCITVL